MAEPVTAAAIASIVVASAAAQFGQRAGDALADGVFGRSNDFRALKKQLQQIDLKLAELLTYSRKIYALVERLPEVFGEVLDKNTAYLAHAELRASIEAYMLLPEWNDSMGHSAYANLIKSWSILVDKETTVEGLLELPRYGEYLLLVSNGRLRERVQADVARRLQGIDSAINVLSNDQLSTAAKQASEILATPYVTPGGNLLNSDPWLAWAMKPLKIDTVTVCALADDNICWKEQQPDKSWNTSRANVNAKLTELQAKMSTLTQQLRAAVLIRETLTRYSSTLKSRQGVPAGKEITLVNSPQRFPALSA